MIESKNGQIAAKIFRRELIGSFLLYCFPLMIVISAILVNEREDIFLISPLLIFVFPGLIVIFVAYTRTRFYHGADYRPNSKNLATFFAIISLMFVLERVAYSLIYTPDVYGIIAVSAMLAATLVWFALSKEKLEVRSIAKMLILASTLFTFIWLVFAAIVRTLYGFVVLLKLDRAIFCEHILC